MSTRNRAARLARGRFSPRELRYWVGLQAVVFWGLILVCWIIYPTENRYSIMTHTFSFLGSFEAKHNPQGWWLFSAAMVFWGSSQAPVALYIGHRLSVVSRWGARVAAALLLLACVGTVFVGLFPDARNILAGEWRSTDIHEKAAILVAVGYLLGIPWCGALLLRDFVRARRQALPERHLAHGPLVWPLMFWFAVVGVAARFLITWERIYADLRREARETGIQIGSSWAEALNTRYSFPMWENILIYSMYIFLVWFALGLSREPGPKPPNTG